MSSDAGDPLKDFGASFKGFMDQMARNAPKEESEFLRRLREHFGTDPAQLPTITEKIDCNEHPNLQVALDTYLAKPGRRHVLDGLGDPPHYGSWSLASLVSDGGKGMMAGATATPGPVQYTNLPIGDEKVLPCIEQGLYRIHDGETPLALLVAGVSKISPRENLEVEVMGPSPAACEKALGELRRLMAQHNIYRGQVISLVPDWRRGHLIKFHPLPKIDREGIILPSGLLEKIERETIQFARYAEKLKAAGRHLRRGLLFHGPPGTGKTLTAMYLAGSLPDRTIFLLTGESLALIEPTCRMARLLQPSIVILEDVDLVAEERTANKTCGGLLFQLLNQMDGLASDAEILFLLTTNRPDLLEPALAARPGRVDQALEIPLPDEAGRRRLFELYGRSLEMKLTRMDEFIRRTNGVSAAFIRELIRKAALFAAEKSDPLVVEDTHLDEALRLLVLEGGPLTRSLLGFKFLKEEHA